MQLKLRLRLLKNRVDLVNNDTLFGNFYDFEIGYRTHYLTQEKALYLIRLINDIRKTVFIGSLEKYWKYLKKSLQMRTVIKQQK